MKNLIFGECLESMKQLPSNSVDAVVTDPPFGIIQCAWDSVIPFDEMWKQLSRIIKPKSVVVFFGSEPFSSALRMSNVSSYKYDWIWQKNKSTGFLNAKKQPLNDFENICVFYEGQCCYNPQKTQAKKKI